MRSFTSLVQQERLLQDAKWGEQNHGPIIWYMILAEEVGELAGAILPQCPCVDREKVENELIQVAAVCKAMWESGKRNGWL